MGGINLLAQGDKVGDQLFHALQVSPDKRIPTVDQLRERLSAAPSVTALLREHGWQVGNVDATVVAQAPRLAPYIPDMRRRLAEAMGLDVDCVSVKATTEERLGFTGSGEGMAAHAVALIERLN